MNKLDKTQEGQTLLDDGNNYKPIEDSMAGANFQKVKQIVEELHQGSFIDEMTVKWLSQTPNHPEYLSSTLSQRFISQLLLADL